MIENLSRRMATSLKSRVPDHPASVDVLAYAFNFTLNTSLSVIIAFTIALILKQVLAVLIVLISFAILRSVSGGYHFKSALACVLVSAIGANLVPFITLSEQATLWTTVASLVLVLLYAPSRIENQTRIPKRFFPLLKVISCGLVSLNFIFGSALIAATFFIQSVTLLISLILERGLSIDEKAESAV